MLSALLSPAHGFHSIADAAQKLDIAAASIRNLRSGKHAVQRGLVTHVAQRLNATLKLEAELVVENLIVPTLSRIPTDVDFFSGLRYGWFRDTHDVTGEVGWHQETIRFTAINVVDDRRITMEASIKNRKNNSFRGQAQRIDERLFSLVAMHEKQGRSFTAAFCGLKKRVKCDVDDPRRTEKYDDVLCGVWSGVDAFYDQTAARMFLSKERLANDVLDDVARSVWVSDLTTFARRKPR